MESTFYTYIFDQESQGFTTPNVSTSIIFKNDFKISDVILTSLIEVDVEKVAQTLYLNSTEALETTKAVVNAIFRCQNWETRGVHLGDSKNNLK